MYEYSLGRKLMFFKKTKDPEKVCRFCSYATLLDDDKVSCRIRGEVKADYSCRKYIYDCLKREPRRQNKSEGLEYVDLND